MTKKRKKPARKLPKPTRTQRYTIKTRRSSGDLVEIQLHVRLKRVPKGLKITPKLLESMVRRKAQQSSGVWDAGMGMTVGAHEGPNPKGIEIKIVRWRNPGRSGRKASWRYADNQADAWGSLWRILAAVQYQFRKMG